MIFNFKLFFKLSYYAVFKHKGTLGQITLKRAKVLLFWYFVFIPYCIFTWICFLLDEILFPAYRDQNVDDAVFILGNFRSGSSMLQRLLARDDKNFTALRTWEIYLAPSITQRKIVHWFSAIDRRWFNELGSKFIDDLDERVLGVIPMHRMGLKLFDEDEGILLYNWTSMFLLFVFPFPEVLPPFDQFDAALSDKDKHIAMSFYKRCIQRHVYYHGGKCYLAKNPASSSRIEALRKYFMNAKFVYLARNPIDLVPSQTSYFSFCWHYFNDVEEKYPLRDLILESTRNIYLYPMEKLVEFPDREWLLMSYDELVGDLDGKIQGIYQHFNLIYGTEFRDVVSEFKSKADKYISTHQYSLDEMGYTPDQILEFYKPVFDHFKFSVNGKAMLPLDMTETIPEKILIGGLS